MDISRIERRIKKINSVLDVFKEDNKLSVIERDLLLGYIRELYDLIRESDAEVVEVKHENSLTKSIEKEALKTEVVKIEDVKKAEPTHAISKPLVEVVIPKVHETPIISVPVEEQKPGIEKVMVQEEILPKVKETAIRYSSSEVSEELAAVFMQEEITDLTEKLSRSKIEDISKVIGINERLFTINELFGSDGKFFDSIIKKLNSSENFESAKNILINEVAIPLNWEKEGKLKQAQQFVKHVRRKFN